jgi:hypothetical protein
MAETMLAKGVPVVPRGQAPIRAQVWAADSREDLTFAVKRRGVEALLS